MEAWLISFGIRGGALPHTLAFLKPRKRETEGGGRGQRRSRRATDGARSGSRSQWRLCGPNFPADTPTRVCLLTVLGGLACLLAGEGGIEGGAEAGGGDVGVDLGGGDGGVAEELADVHEGGAVFEEVGGVGVAEGVGGGLGAFGQEGVDAAVDDGGNQGAAGAATGGTEKERGAGGEEIGGQVAFLIGLRRSGARGVRRSAARSPFL